MLPIPILKFFPKIFQSDNKAITLAAYIDTLLLSVKNDVLQLPRLYKADEINSLYLTELGYFLNANLKNSDTDTIKRKKILNAIYTHKIRGTWKYDVKLRIDTITGYDAEILDIQSTSDWILTGDGASEWEYYSTLGGDGLDDNLGMNLVGAGDEIEITGNVYINLHSGIYTPILTNDILINIVNEIKDDVVPAYYRIYLGYINVNGIFQEYTIYNTTQFEVANPPYYVCYDGINIWISTYTSNTIIKINPNTNTILATISLLGTCEGLCFDGATHIWATDYTNNNVIKINTSTNAIVATIVVGTHPTKIILGSATHVYVSNQDDNTISKINISTNVVDTTISLVNNDPMELVSDATHIWATSYSYSFGEISKINISTNVVDATVPVGSLSYSIAFDGVYVWVATWDGDIVKVDISTNTVLTTIPFTTSGRIKIIYADSFIWVAYGTGASGKIAKINPKTNAVLTIINIGYSIIDLFYDNKYLWIPVASFDNLIFKIEFIKSLEE